MYVFTFHYPHVHFFHPKHYVHALLFIHDKPIPFKEFSFMSIRFEFLLLARSYLRFLFNQLKHFGQITIS
jgi:hypothetical protein